MNDQHLSMEFSSEFEIDGVLPFLDVLVSSVNGKFVTSVYRKPTFSGVFSNFSSFIPDCFKFGLVHCLLFRSFNLCSSYAKFHEEVLSLKSVLSRNAYPMCFLDNCIGKFLNSVFRTKKSVTCSVEKKPVFIVLPFTGVSSLHVRNRIVSLCKKYLPQVKCRVVFRPSVRLSHLFVYKDRVPLALKSGVVYKFQCGGCNAPYYGKTIRHYHTRISEHLGISALTGKPVCSPAQSAVFDHVLSCSELDDRPSTDSFSVIASAAGDFQLKIKESLLIARDRPCLNDKISSLPLYLF